MVPGKLIQAVEGSYHHLRPGAKTEDFTAPQALVRAWLSTWRADSHQPLLQFEEQGWISAQRLEQESYECAQMLQNIGIGIGDRVLICAESSWEMVKLYVALLRISAVAVMANPAYTQTELAHIVNDSRPKAFLATDPVTARFLSQMRVVERPFSGPGEDLPSFGGAMVNVASIGPLGRSSSLQSSGIDQANSDTPALICYTSGTTGKPKGALLSQGNLYASAAAFTHAWEWESDDRLLLALPLFHIHGLGVGLNGTLMRGASATVLARFNPGRVLDLASRADHSLFFGVPTMYLRLAGEGSRASTLSSFRLLVSGSAPMPTSLHEAIHALSGQYPLERYGMTETVMNVSNPLRGERHPGTVGFPLPAVEVAIDYENSEILLKGPNVFGGYLDNPAATKEAFSSGGYFRSGDAGEVDNEGYLTIRGRLKEMIITGGYNVYPREIEEALRLHPAIEDAGVVGVPSAVWGEEVCAFVIARDSVSEVELLEHLGGHLVRYKHPKRFIFVDEFPRNALGKVISSELRRLGSS